MLAAMIYIHKLSCIGQQKMDYIACFWCSYPSGGSSKRLDQIKLKKYIHFIEGSNKLFFSEN